MAVARLRPPIAPSLPPAPPGGLHCTRAAAGAFHPIFPNVAESADALALFAPLPPSGDHAAPGRRGRGRVARRHNAPASRPAGAERVEMFPFLGSSRLEEPLNRYRPSVVFHGHAHRGQPEGPTSPGVPVYNVALPLLRRHYPDQPPVRVVAVPLPEDPPTEARPSGTLAPPGQPAEPARPVSA